ncbi:hypothetical protein ACFE04_011038 [Oxalis oulophora]
MVRNPSSNINIASGLKRGPWTPEEDQKLIAYIEQHGHESWRSLPLKAGLQRCGKSCRLRWTNYLRPDIKRGKFTSQEEQTIIQLHALLGNRWSAMAAYLPKRTDNEIKNYWNTHLKKRLTKNGIDPVTHKPKAPRIDGGDPRNASNLSHIAQWESARLEAEARLVKEAKKLNQKTDNNIPRQPNTTTTYHHHDDQAAIVRRMACRIDAPPCLDILKAWEKVSSYNNINNSNNDLESPTSTLNFQEWPNNIIIGSSSSLSCEINVGAPCGEGGVLFGNVDDLSGVLMMGKSQMDTMDGFSADLLLDHDLGVDMTQAYNYYHDLM